MSSSNPKESGHEFLDQIYTELGYVDGELLNAVKSPSINSAEAKNWVEKGDWLSLASHLNAEKVFFVNNEPVFVFYHSPQSLDKPKLQELLRKFWCMARPQCLFLALPGELRVYSLNILPSSLNTDNLPRPLDVVYKATEVSSKLHEYRREQVETGLLFTDDRFGVENRADRRLIQDLISVRRSLKRLGLEDKYSHALIGRAIFIRYLEDRGVLTPSYYENVAKQQPSWRDILDEEDPFLVSFSNREWANRRFYRILINKELTYAFFRQLSMDFNGDMFPNVEEEKEKVSQTHLNLLRKFLLGDSSQSQASLFFWAYDFDIIPIQLISSIYEEFYQSSSESLDDKGTHYTPSSLVDYVLSNILTSEKLATNPKILDPACGSGIFLVEAFRRIVRYKTQLLGHRLKTDELRNILKEQLFGIEINSEAIRVTAFSLYLSLLNYQEPPDILQSKKLPNLIISSSYQKSEQYYQCLYDGSAFDLTKEEMDFYKSNSLRSLKKFPRSSKTLPFRAKSFDVIIGNPPWGNEVRNSQLGRENREQIISWCKLKKWPLGANELSQAFIARSISLLDDERGECGLLVSAGVFLKTHLNSQNFRKHWLSQCSLNLVANFTHVRKAYFNNSIAPFMFVLFNNFKPITDHRFQYWSAKHTATIDNTLSIIFSLSDLKMASQTDFLRNESLWKVYWWGSYHDANLISSLNYCTPLSQIVDERGWITGCGFIERKGKGKYQSDWLQEYKELPVKFFGRYKKITPEQLINPPKLVHQRGIREIYSGWRILVNEGITQIGKVKGIIDARLELMNFSFRDSIYGISMSNSEEWERVIILGILWSSLARYYYFLTGSSWGLWHDKILKNELLRLPIILPEDMELRARIVHLVKKLIQGSSEFGCLDIDYQRKIRRLEQDLDSAIFDMYELTEAERDLVLDFCKVNLNFYYYHSKSEAVKPVYKDFGKKCGYVEDVINTISLDNGLDGYLYAFLDVWNRELAPNGEFRWQVIAPADSSMLAVTFTTQNKDVSKAGLEIQNDSNEWNDLLERCSKVLLQPVSSKVYLDGVIRIVTSSDIVIIKRNELRYWTRSAAREDADSTLVQAIGSQRLHSSID